MGAKQAEAAGRRARLAGMTRNMMPFGSNGAPRVVAVTGHRDLVASTVARLEVVVQGELQRLQDRTPSTPLVLLSALAEGADRLVARIALRVGHKLVAPLPMAVAEYEKDFTAPGSLEEFRGLLADAAQCFVVPGDAAGLPRDNGYERLACYLAEHSDVLLALWDGVAVDRLGSTSRVVELKLRNERTNSAAPGDAMVIHVATPRLKNPTIEAPPRVVYRRPG